MNIPIDFDIEHSRILEQLPIFAILIFFVIIALPIIPQELKSTILLFGLGGIFVFMFAIGPIARYTASQYIPIKTRIRPGNIEKTFYCKKPTGTISTIHNEKLGIYTTFFELGIKTTLPKYGQIDGIEIEHRRPFDERNLGTEVYVMFMGNEVTHSRVILAELWLTRPEVIKIDHMQRILRCEMAVGGEDFWIAMKNRKDGYAGPYYIDLRNYNEKR